MRTKDAPLIRVCVLEQTMYLLNVVECPRHVAARWYLQSAASRTIALALLQTTQPGLLDKEHIQMIMFFSLFGNLML